MSLCRNQRRSMNKKSRSNSRKHYYRTCKRISRNLSRSLRDCSKSCNTRKASLTYWRKRIRIWRQSLIWKWVQRLQAPSKISKGWRMSWASWSGTMRLRSICSKSNMSGVSRPLNWLPMRQEHSTWVKSIRTSKSRFPSWPKTFHEMSSKDHQILSD